MLNSVDADDYMTANPVIFSPETDIYEAIQVLVERRVTGGTVLNDQGEVVGIVSELDCLKAVIQTGYYGEGGGTVADFMFAGNIQFMDDHANIVDAAQKLLASGRRRMPVRKDGKFLGQVSARSLLMAFVAAVNRTGDPGS
ncbi:CBS domain-containing protein [Teredinibacter turnerae]|uniref:CBS domain-containing protein n=1 Tax=Teredinibacter turnerae TaxID=2426 RepID=UPI000413D50A|nr:CBS domain-containing protein [Teredinibacter turnerae]